MQTAELEMVQIIMKTSVYSATVYFLQLRFGIMVRDRLIFLVGTPILEGHKTFEATSAQPRVGEKCT